MKNAKHTIIILFCCLFFLNACQKDIDIFVPDPAQPNLPDTNWVSTITDTMPVSLLKNSLLLPVHTDSFLAGSNSVSLLSPSGLACTFSSAALVNSLNQTITGNVYVETFLLKKKGDMIRMDKPTTSNGNILISGGELMIRFKKDGATLTLSQQGSISISYTDSAPSSLMGLYYGDESNPVSFDWTANTDSNNSLLAANLRYTIQSKKTGWMAIGRPLQSSGQASISIMLPGQFTNANTMAYLVSGSTGSVIKMNGEASIRKFTSGALPYGSNFTVVVLSKQGGNYFWISENITTTPGVVNQSFSLNPAITTLNNIEAYLDSL